MTLDAFGQLLYDDVLVAAVRPAEGVFRWPYVTAAPFYATISGQWLWDAGYVAWALAKVGGEVELARGVVRNVVATAVVDGPDRGMLLHAPDVTGRQPALIDGTSQTPMMAWLAARLHALAPDRRFVEDVYPGLAAHVSWWRSPRRDVDGDGLSEYAGPNAKAALHESGLDVAPVRDLLLAEPPDASADGLVHDVVADVGLNSFLHAECVALAELAELVAPADVSRWRAEADRIATAMQEVLWCDDVGAFMPAYRRDLYPTQPHVVHVTGNVLLPVWAGVATEEQTRRAVDLVTGRWQEFPGAEGVLTLRLVDEASAPNGIELRTHALRPHVGDVVTGLDVARTVDGWRVSSSGDVLAMTWPRDRAVTGAWFNRLVFAAAVVGRLTVSVTDGDGHAYELALSDREPQRVLGEVAGPPTAQPVHGLSSVVIRGEPGTTVKELRLSWTRPRPTGLLSAYGIRSLHPLDGKFPRDGAPTHFWSGTVWPPYVWHTYQALLIAGEHALAREQAQAFVEGVRRAFRQGVLAPEHLCDATAVGMGADHQAWTAAVALLLAEASSHAGPRIQERPSSSRTAIVSGT